MEKKIITIAMLAALAVGSAVSLTACGGGDNSGSSSAAPESSSSAPASSAAEAVSEAAAPSSKTEATDSEDPDYETIELDTEGKSVADLLDGVSVKNGVFAESPLEIAKRFKIALDSYAENSADNDCKIMAIERNKKTKEIAIVLENDASINIDPNEKDDGVTSSYITVVYIGADEKSDVTKYEKVIGTALFGTSWEKYRPSKLITTEAESKEKVCVFGDTASLITYEKNADGKSVPMAIGIQAKIE